MTIKVKLISVMILSLVVAATTITLFNTAHNTLSHNKDSEIMIAEAQADMLMLRRHEKDFLARKDPKYVEKFTLTIKEMRGDIANLNKRIIESDFSFCRSS